MRPYSWKENTNRIDLQELTYASFLHPVLKLYSEDDLTPVLRDLDRDISFIKNPLADNARSLIDQITSK